METGFEGGLDVRVSALADQAADAPKSRRKLDAESFDRVLRDSVDPEITDDVAAWRDAIATEAGMRVDYATASMIVRLQPSDFAREFTGLLTHGRNRGVAGLTEALLPDDFRRNDGRGLSRLEAQQLQFGGEVVEALDNADDVDVGVEHQHCGHGSDVAKQAIDWGDERPRSGDHRHRRTRTSD